MASSTAPIDDRSAARDDTGEIIIDDTTRGILAVRPDAVIVTADSGARSCEVKSFDSVQRLQARITIAAMGQHDHQDVAVVRRERPVYGRTGYEVRRCTLRSAPDGPRDAGFSFNAASAARPPASKAIRDIRRMDSSALRSAIALRAGEGLAHDPFLLEVVHRRSDSYCVLLAKTTDLRARSPRPDARGTTLAMLDRQCGPQ